MAHSGSAPALGAGPGLDTLPILWTFTRGVRIECEGLLRPSHSFRIRPCTFLHTPCLTPNRSLAVGVLPLEKFAPQNRGSASSQECAGILQLVAQKTERKGDRSELRGFSPGCVALPGPRADHRSTRSCQCGAYQSVDAAPMTFSERAPSDPRPGYTPGS
jgi:hypothetical protein